MNSLSIITAYGRHEHDYLSETAHTVAELSDLIPTEWIVSIDSPEIDPYEISRVLPTDHPNLPVTVLPWDTAPTGPGPARSRALTHAHHEWCMYVDSDDRLVAEGVACMIDVAAENDTGWVTGLTRDINTNGGVTWAGPGPLLPYGLILPGAVLAYVEENGSMPLMCNSVAARTRLVKAAGGWPALRRGQDVALVAVLSEMHPGWMEPVYVHEYRQHDGSRTASSEWQATPPPWELIREMATIGSTDLPDILAAKYASVPGYRDALVP